MWTQFWDMHSGGGSKEQWTQIFIEAEEKEAKTVFYNRFGHNPDRVTCTCCGSDYSISEYETLEQATGFHRGCKYIEDIGYVEEPDDSKYVTHQFMTLDDFIKEDYVLVIYENEIKPEEVTGDIPEQGYVWVD